MHTLWRISSRDSLDPFIFLDSKNLIVERNWWFESFGSNDSQGIESQTPNKDIAVSKVNSSTNAFDTSPAKIIFFFSTDDISIINGDGQ